MSSSFFQFSLIQYEMSGMEPELESAAPVSRRISVAKPNGLLTMLRLWKRFFKRAWEGPMFFEADHNSSEVTPSG
jgi:hypothetical protein